MGDHIMVDSVETGYQIIHKIYQDNKTVDDIAKVTDTTPHTVYAWINGRKLPSTDQLFIMARYLGCLMDDLIVGDDSERLDLASDKEKELPA